ncbi:AAA-16 domain-containing protein [Phanerochaete sordida]|uniref:AAA-16 domain-containing protein n=1 Tax=Phanerochaete sordida TaxID=48140 RepID=A0A9P3GMR4_9APHY|nr:AAA-16 domain-containing protein [Phanerochaete sordida]
MSSLSPSRAERRIQRIVDAVEPGSDGQDTPHFERYAAQLRRVAGLVRQAEGVRTISLEQRLSEAINSNDELRERARNLLSQIPDLSQRERTSTRGWRTQLKATLKRSLSTKNQNSKIDVETARELDKALDSFLLRDLDQLEDVFVTVMNAYNAATERRDQFQAAEESANFIAQVIGEARSYRSLDSSDYTAASRRRTTSSEDTVADIDLWLAGDMPVYLLTGDIGTGKTHIAYQLCVRLRSSSQSSLNLGTSFFFDAEDKNSIDLLLSSLAYQARPDLRTETLAAVRRCRSTPSAMPNSPFRQMLRDVLASTPPSECIRTVVVIDGVDQCWSRIEVPDLLQYLLTLVSDFPWLRLFLTLRPHPYIMATLARHSFFSRHIHQRHLNEDIQDYAGDVQHYLEDKLQRLHSYDTYLRKHPRALLRLAKLAQGDFTFAHVAVNFLACPGQCIPRLPP